MKRIIVYFSWSNNTKRLVEEIVKEEPMDVVRVERLIPYSKDYNQCAYVEAKEEIDQRIHPAIKKLNINFNDYDEILLFFPIWWYTFPMPIATFIEQLNGYKGQVVLFGNSYTNDPQYMENSIRDFKVINKNIKVSKGLFNKNVKAHIEYLRKE